jgi:tRNA nucleotidyltransferase (CCA-adding enzyme)
MVIITTHTNADFDSLASMAAAGLLYKGAKLVFPGACEALLRRYMDEHAASLPEVLSVHGLDLAEVEKLVCVDVADRARLGPLSALLDRVPPVRVDVFDHHPAQVSIRGERHVVKDAGACSSLMVEELLASGIAPDKDLCTLILLGIYEDTGFLTFPTTRPRDLEAARRCLLWGADLSQVSRVLTRRLTEPQLRILTRLVERLETVTAGGVTVHITTFSSAQYVPDLSLLIHEIFNLEDLDALFLVARLENRIHIIGRSRVPGVDVARVLETFGGGGHPSAASASLKGVTLEEAKRLLTEELTTNRPVGLTARDVMARDFHRIAANALIQEAFEEMNRRHVNALPLFEGDTLVGVVTRQEVDGAIQHGMRSEPVKTLVATKPPLLPPDTPLEVVRRLMLERSLRLVLFGNSPDKVEGLLSRMALFKSLYLMEPGRLPKRRGGVPSRLEVQRLMAGTFTESEMNGLKELGALGDAMGTPVLLVGGAVRDLLLRRPVKDVDFVVEGDAVALAQAWSERQGGRLRTHKEFGTAVCICPNGRRWDFATARSEYYEAPAALPTVVHAALSQDLYRRDFTINALALDLSAERFGEILDLFGGVRDLKSGQIRVMHGLSFVEDPTRAFRAARFAVTLGFKLPAETEGLLSSALKQGIFRNLSPKRVLGEVIQTLACPNPVEGLSLLEKYGLLKVFWPALKLSPKVRERLGRVQKVLDFFELHFPAEPIERPSLFVMALAERLPKNELDAFRSRYPFQAPLKSLLADYRSLVWRARQQLALEAKSAGAVYRLLFDKPLLFVLYLLTQVDKAEEQALIRDFVTRDRFLKLEITGEDLKAAGLPPSEAFARALLETKIAKADGLLSGRASELAFALKQARKYMERSDGVTE